MLFRSSSPIVKVEPGSLHTIDTSNAENLFGLWSVFSKCAGSMEDGKRLENLSWRLWNRETFCCPPQQQQSLPQRFSFPRRKSNNPSLDQVPDLVSSSVESDGSFSDGLELATRNARTSSTRPEIRRQDSSASTNRGNEPHITPIDLQKIVVSIKEKKELEPLPPLPSALSLPKVSQANLAEETAPSCNASTTTPKACSDVVNTQTPSHSRTIPDSSTSTVATAVHSDLSEMSPPVGSETSTSTDLSTHSIVRGFAPGRVSSSYRSSTQLAPAPTPILKTSPHNRAVPAKKKGATFTLGGSSGEGDDSSFETRYGRSSALSESFRKPGVGKKQTSFKDEVRTIPDRSYDSEEAIESDSEDEDQMDSAIDDEYDDDDTNWEDDEEAAAEPEVEEPVFKRVDSRPNLRKNESLLTNLMHEKDRMAALQNAASRSTPAIRRSRAASPNGPLMTISPPEDTITTTSALNVEDSQIPRSKPIIMTTSNTHPPAMSPRATRRNMLATELTESLRKHLLWERQHKNSTNNAAIKRRHTSTDVKNLKHYPGESLASLAVLKEGNKATNSWNNYFDSGLQEYHERGW
ncbi:DUF1752-domain-containing protein [Aulographum hederae CBS 113979]|uniref:DUF1752-domain-containing protein n=1 Tax=Aulographum hederae CBS 113979 TaxID=1176131 RepID=A0A6G1GVF4_9PEZI|nr:DUF1752-domain-containing protein [Aulographum hederae CBS 113979]